MVWNRDFWSILYSLNRKRKEKKKISFFSSSFLLLFFMMMILMGAMMKMRIWWYDDSDNDKDKNKNNNENNTTMRTTTRTTKKTCTKTTTEMENFHFWGDFIGIDATPVIQLVLMIHWISAQHVPLIYSMQVNFVMFSFKTAIWKKMKWPKRVKITPDKFCN